MKESWRWYGPLDRITLAQIAQTGASTIVTALHEIPYGEVWSPEAIEDRHRLVRADPELGLEWEVVESLPVHERIKRGEGDLSGLFANYRQSLANLAAAGVRVVCYNFMPLLDWTRTDTALPLSRGGTALHFSAPHMAAFELHMLGREEAAGDYAPEAVAAGTAWFEGSTVEDRERLLTAIMAGLPGAYDRYSVDGLRDALARYDGIDRETLKANYARFLREVVPTAAELGMRLCVHPDDPPRDILGLPRIVTDADDIANVLGMVDERANGLTLCSGSLGANPANDVAEIAERFGDRIHFVHLRNVAKRADGSFTEAAHLEGDTDMVAVCAALLTEEERRREAGREDRDLPFRPDHGHELLDDAGRQTHPGYPLVGRMRGLAELRGVLAGLRGGGAQAL